MLLRPVLTAAMLAVMPATLHTSTAPQRPSPAAPAVKPAPHTAPVSKVRTTPKARTSATTRRTPQLSVVQLRLQQNPALAGTVTGRLPVGADLMTVSSGFRNLGEFVAAVNASNNLGIPFVDLKRRIVNDGMSLGLAIQDVRPKSQYWSEARRAEDEAARLIQASETALPVIDPAAQPRTKSRSARPGSRGVA